MTSDRPTKEQKPHEKKWTATVHFEGASPDVIRAALESIQESLVRMGQGSIKRASVSETAKRHKNAFDRSFDILIEMHRGMSIPHPMTWSMTSRGDNKDADDVMGDMTAAVAVTTDPDDARLLTALTQIVWSKTLAKERLRELVVAYLKGDDPGAVIRSLGPEPDPGLDLAAVHGFFLDHFGSA